MYGNFKMTLYKYYLENHVLRDLKTWVLPKKLKIIIFGC